MGAVAIWCMHFVGNRALVLDLDQPELQIAYSSGFTALSFFVPILVILAAFLIVGSNERVGRFRVACGGTLAGLAICGMHYLGEAGIANYSCVYDPVYVAVSAVIAVVASVGTLSIFFLLRAAWTNSWWKRSLCAILLAATASAMHWVALAGTQYRFKGTALGLTADISREQIVYIVIALVRERCRATEHR